MIKQRSKVNAWMIIAILFSVFLVIAYIILYQWMPLSGAWNDALLAIISVLSSVLAALAAWLVYNKYRPEDTPRRIWKFMMIGFACWPVGEIIWERYYTRGGDVPIPSAADFFWIIGYLFFTLALYYQYRIITRLNKKKVFFFAIGIWVVILTITGLTVLLTGNPFNLTSLISYFYPTADLGLGIVALVIMLSFGRGALARPWFGLFIFTISDLLYAWLDLSGLYAWSYEQGNLLSLISDTTYIAAYLVVALGFFSYFLLIKREQDTIPRI